jgi:hypothetical protein
MRVCLAGGMKISRQEVACKVETYVSGGGGAVASINA